MTYIMTTDPQRREKWLHLFGTDVLPVKQPAPRWRVERGAFGRETEALGYDLDASRLHPMALIRFADYVSRKTGHRHSTDDVDGWLITAAGCAVVDEDEITADSARWQKRPFFDLDTGGALTGAFV